MDDPRVAPVGDNLVAFMRVFASYDGFHRGDEPEVVSLWSEHAYPLFNAITGGDFAPGSARQRAHEIIAPYFERGLPFMWWATPSAVLEELRDALVDAGMTEERAPGMYLDLAGPLEPELPAGVELRVASSERELAESLDVMVEGFEMPEELKPGMLGVLPLYGDSVVQALAALDGEPVATGTLFVDGQTAGLYNITTLAPARGRGLGYAVTAALLDQAQQRGCEHAILHSTVAGFPVYQRLGFRTVCEVPQFLWLP
jgi:GNAT superfamily N-acetyltransferase